MSKLKDYSVIVFEGEGYYSGNTESNLLFIKKENLTDEMKDFLAGYTPYYPELDGKHTEVAGKVAITDKITYRHLTSGFIYNYDKILDDLEDHLDESFRGLTEDHEEFIKRIEVITQVKFDGDYI